MQRKPLYPVANCNIKMPEAIHSDCVPEDDGDQQQRRLQLINFGHSQWGFNNWSWSVTKQELDFVDATNGKFTAGVVAFVSITVKSLDIHRENIGYATSIGSNKGYAIYKSRKCAVTNALRETLLSFGGTVAAELGELLETFREPEAVHENNQNIPNQPAPVPSMDRPKNLPECANRPPPPVNNPCANTAPPVAPPVAAPMAMPPCTLAPPRSAPPPGRAPRSNVSFVLHPVYGTVPGARYPATPHYAPNYYEYYYPPRPEPEAPPQTPGCWIKPTIFYDGFWTEQKVKKWVAEQVEKQFPENQCLHRNSSAPANVDGLPKS